ncbi:MAG TPA: DUF6476 family protein [Rhizomicrobium sp.]|nr:DUF6476 family protein [Rhizomicrobium sp.]
MSDIGADPGASQSYRMLRAVVIVLGALIVIALAILAFGVATKIGGRGGARGPEASAYALPRDARILDMQTSANRLILRVQTGTSQEVYVFDADNGRLIARIAPAK